MTKRFFRFVILTVIVGVIVFLFVSCSSSVPSPAATPMITSLPAATSTPQSDSPIRLTAPQVEIGANGSILFDDQQGAEHYLLENTETGEITIFDTYNPFITPNQTYRIMAVGDEVRYLSSEYSDIFEYKVESITFSAQNHSAEQLERNEDGTFTLSAVSNLGNSYHFRLEGELLPSENAWGILSPGSLFYSLDALHGITGIHMNGTESYKFRWSLGYETDGNDQISSHTMIDHWEEMYGMTQRYSHNDLYGNFLCMGHKEAENPMEITEFTIYFDGIETEHIDCSLQARADWPLYLPGNPYQVEHEPYNIVLNFRHANQSIFPLNYFGEFQEGDFLDAHGNVIVSPQDHRIQQGDGIVIHLESGATAWLNLASEALTNARTANDHHPNTLTQATGTVNLLVVPIVWSDQQDRATEANLDIISTALGNIMDTDGSVKDHSDENLSAVSLSRYFDTASYGQLNLQSYVTDWYPFPLDFETACTQDWNQEYYTILEWVKTQYPNLDISRFDSDEDGVIDEVVFIHSGDFKNRSEGIPTSGLTGTYRYQVLQDNKDSPVFASPHNPLMLHFLNLSFGDLFDASTVGRKTDLKTRILIRTVGYSFGASDLRDVGYRNLSFLGGYDMMDMGYGDWNPYHKFAAGWIQPTIVDPQDFEAQDSVTYTLRSSAIHPDALVIPAYGWPYEGSPFDEYLIVDLFTPQGLHEKDSAAYDLQDSVGVRMYHVSDRLIRRSEPDQNGTFFYGLHLYTNNSETAWSRKYGYHQLEILSSTGSNRFNRSNDYTAEDLFEAGDSFSAETFQSFFHQGLMDTGIDFGYQILVESIDLMDGEYIATIRVTRIP